MESFDPLISIVIPVYNVEKYLDKCMESVLNQTYDNYEVILVDDGSTDNSGKMCDEYAKKDSRVTVYHKPNGGLSDARNYGVEHSNADLVSFIDSDDYVTEDYLEYLWLLMEKYDASIVRAGKMTVTKYEDVRKVMLNKNDVVEKLTVADALCDVCLTTSACSRLYRKEILLKHPFPVGRFYEDLATVYKLISECDFMIKSTHVIYFYLSHSGSISHNGISDKQFDIFWAADNLYKYISENYPKCKNVADVRYIISTSDYLNNVFEYCNKSDRRKYFKIARNYALPHLKEAARCKYPIPFKSALSMKIKCAAIYLGYIPTSILWKVRDILKR